MILAGRGSLALWLLLASSLAFANSECLIIANGTPLHPRVLKALAPSKQIVALDGAVKVLQEKYKRKIVPDVVLGDFDSSTEKNRKFFRKALIVHAPSQEFTDLEKGIQYCDEKEASGIWIVNALGLSRMDHTLANLNFLKKYYLKNRRLRLVSEFDVVEYIKDDEVRISGKRKEPVGVFGFPQAWVSSVGLEYPMEHFAVSIGESLSSSNYMTSDTASVSIQGEALVSYPHRLGH